MFHHSRSVVASTVVRSLLALVEKQRKATLPPTIVRNRRLQLEQLGERIVPAGITFTWTGNGANNLASNPMN